MADAVGLHATPVLRWAGFLPVDDPIAAPRAALMQGVVSGGAVAIGFGFGFGSLLSSIVRKLIRREPAATFKHRAWWTLAARPSSWAASLVTTGRTGKTMCELRWKWTAPRHLTVSHRRAHCVCLCLLLDDRPIYQRRDSSTHPVWRPILSAPRDRERERRRDGPLGRQVRARCPLRRHDLINQQRLLADRSRDKPMDHPTRLRVAQRWRVVQICSRAI